MKFGISMICLATVLWIYAFTKDMIPHHSTPVVVTQPAPIVQPQPVVAPQPLPAAPTINHPTPAPLKISEDVRTAPVISYAKAKEDAKSVQQSRMDLQDAVQRSRLAEDGPGFDGDHWTGTLNYQVREFTTRIGIMQKTMHQLQSELAALRKYQEGHGADTQDVLRAQQVITSIQGRLDADVVYANWVERQMANRIVASR